MILSTSDCRSEGVWFIRRGEVILSGDKWKVVVAINVTQVNRELGALYTQTVETEATLLRASGRMPDLEVQLPTIRRILELEEDMIEMGRTLAALLPRKPERTIREKRGLINLGGKVAKFIFGVAEEEDVQTLEKSLAALNNQVGSVIHLQEDHLLLTRRLSHDLENQGRELAQLMNRVGQMAEVFEIRLSALERNVSALDIFVHYLANTTSVLQQLEMAALRALVDLKSLIEVLEVVEQGRLSINLLSPLELSELLEKIRASLPPGINLAVGYGPALVYEHYRACKVRAVATGDLIKFIVDLPLTAMGRKFELLQVIAVPVIDRQSSLKVRYNVHKDYFLVSDDRSSYAEPPETFQLNCRPGPVHVCPAEYPVFARSHPTCLSSLFFSNMDMARKLCGRNVIAEQYQDAWEWDEYNQQWIYSLANTTKILSQCQVGDRVTVTEIVLNGTGELKARRRCQLTTKEYRLLPTLIGRSDEEIQHRIVHIKLPSQLILRRGEEFTIPTEEFVRQAKQEGRMWPGKLGIETELEALVAANHAIGVSHNITEEKGWPTAGVIAAVFVIVAVLGVVAYRIKKRFHRRSKPGSTTEAENPSVMLEPMEISPRAATRSICRLTPEERASLPRVSEV